MPNNSSFTLEAIYGG